MWFHKVYGSSSSSSATSRKESSQSAKISKMWFDVCSVSSTTALWKRQFRIAWAVLWAGVLTHIFPEDLECALKAVIRRNISKVSTRQTFEARSANICTGRRTGLSAIHPIGLTFSALHPRPTPQSRRGQKTDT